MPAVFPYGHFAKYSSAGWRKLRGRCSLGGALHVGVVLGCDYARRAILKGRGSDTTSLDECMQPMAERRARHLPVLDSGELTGVTSTVGLDNMGGPDFFGSAGCARP